MVIKCTTLYSTVIASDLGPRVKLFTWVIKRNNPEKVKWQCLLLTGLLYFVRNDNGTDDEYRVTDHIKNPPIGGFFSLQLIITAHDVFNFIHAVFDNQFSACAQIIARIKSSGLFR